MVIISYFQYNSNVIYAHNLKITASVWGCRMYKFYIPHYTLFESYFPQAKIT